MYRTTDPVQDYEPATSPGASAVFSDALIAVGVLGLIMAALIVSCHLYRLVTRQDDQPVFVADDKLILVYFYAVIIIFAVVAVL